MVISFEKNNGSGGRSREEIENELIVLFKEQNKARAQHRPQEEIMEIGKRFSEGRAELESKSVGGSWDKVKERLDKQMWDKIYEKRDKERKEKEGDHDRLAA